LNTGVERCNGGLNGLAEEPEHISLTFPGSQDSSNNSNSSNSSNNNNNEA
jgi:hypothetical protein